MAVVTMKQLLEAGMHFGHQTRRWNPKMKRFIFGERNGIYIIDLNQTLGRIDTAYSFVRDLVAGGGSVLFVGTKKQTQDAIASAAQRVGMPYVNERWLGGMLTNFQTISGRVKKMAEYERMKESGDFEAMPKKEALILGRELEKLQRNLGGIRNLARLPEAIFVIDTKKEHIAVTEANKLGMPIVAVVDTNCDPDLIQYIVPGNDDAIRAGTLMCRIIADAVEEGRMIASRRNAKAAAAVPAPTVDPEAEARRVHHQAEARRQAALQAQEREARLATSRRPQAADTPADAQPAEPPAAEAPAAVAAPSDGPPPEGPPPDGPPPEGPTSSPPAEAGTASGQQAGTASGQQAGTASGQQAGDAGADQQPAAPTDAVEAQRPAAADPSTPPVPPVAAEAATSTPDAPSAAPAPGQPGPGEG